jgi:hypothetical protein
MRREAEARDERLVVVRFTGAAMNGNVKYIHVSLFSITL